MVAADTAREVIVPALTFVASATAAALVNGVPIIVDVDPETYNISPQAIERAVDPPDRGGCRSARFCCGGHAWGRH